MPTYDYKCKKCKKKFEVFQSMMDKPLSKCPKCGGKPERLIGAGAGLIFKGTGFYQTDYKKSAPSTEKKPSEPKESKPAKEIKKPEKSND